MTKTEKCPRCRKSLVEFTGPVKAKIGAIVYAPDPRSGLLLDTQGERLLTNECYRVGINSLEIRLVSLWSHAEGDDAEFEWHLRRALRAVKGCKVVLLFGTDVTKVILDKGIAAIVGLEQQSAFLPGAILLPVPHPSHTVVKPLGEFRLCLQRVSLVVQKLNPLPARN